MVEKTDSIDEDVACRSAEAGAEPACRGVDGGESEQLLVVDNLPVRAAVTGAELDVVERFFADILDAVLSEEAGEPAFLRHKALP